MISAGFKISDLRPGTAERKTAEAIEKACGDSPPPGMDAGKCVDTYITNPHPFDANDPVYKAAGTKADEHAALEAAKTAGTVPSSGGSGPGATPPAGAPPAAPGAMGFSYGTGNVGNAPPVYRGDKAPFIMALIPKLHLALCGGTLNTDSAPPDANSGEVGILCGDLQLGLTFGVGVNEDSRLHFMPYLDTRLLNNKAVEGSNGMRRQQGYSHIYTAGLEFNYESPGWFAGIHLGYSRLGGKNPFGDGAKFYWPGEGDQVATSYNAASDSFETTDNLLKASGVTVGAQGAWLFHPNLALSVFVDYAHLKDKSHELGNVSQVGTLPIWTFGVGLLGVIPFINQESAPVEKCESGRIMMGACIRDNRSSSQPAQPEPAGPGAATPPAQPGGMIGPAGADGLE